MDLTGSTQTRPEEPDEVHWCEGLEPESARDQAESPSVDSTGPTEMRPKNPDEI